MRVSFAAGILVSASTTLATPVVLTSDTTIEAWHTAIGGVPLAEADVVVRGCNLLFGGAATLRSLRLERSLETNWRASVGPVRRTVNSMERLDLTITGDLAIGDGCSIDNNRKGWSGSSGPGAGSSFVTATGHLYLGGGGHGGAGGGQLPPVVPAPAINGAPYGSATKPTTFGSGGGEWGWPNYSVSGGTGGGVIRVRVGGELTIDGIVSANGGDGSGAQYSQAGGGAGGSIYIEAGRVRGAGTIVASGGRPNQHTGTGGGGRVAVYSSDSTLAPTQIDVRGGACSTCGGPGGLGTVVLGSGSIDIGASPSGKLEVIEGQAAQFAVVATSCAGAVTEYRWRRLDDRSEFQPIDACCRFSGADGPVMSFVAECSDAGEYDVLLSDAHGVYPAPTFVLRVIATADIDRDGFVDDADFSRFAAAYDLLICLDESMPAGCPADFDQDGLVDDRDFAVFVQGYNRLICGG